MVRIFALLVALAVSSPGVLVGPPFSWDRVPGVHPQDFKDEFLATVSRALEELPCYGKCTQAVAVCLRQEPVPATAGRLARDVLTLMASGTGSEEVKKWVEARKRMAHPEKTHTFQLNGLTPLGKKEAPVVVVEFSDFQCPFCAQVAPDLERIIQGSGGKACLYLKQFPLKFHTRAIEAAKACVAAGSFGKFWDLCFKLFEIRDDLSDDNLLKLGKNVGIDPDALKKAMAQEDVLNRIADDKMEGLKHHIDSTPAIFINGKEVLLPPTASLLQDRIEEELDIQAGRD